MPSDKGTEYDKQLVTTELLLAQKNILCADAWQETQKTQWKKWERIPYPNAGHQLLGLEVKQAKLCEKINLKLEKFEKWDVYITNVKPTFRTTAKDAINAVALQFSSAR